MVARRTLVASLAALLPLAVAPQPATAQSPIVRITPQTQTFTNTNSVQVTIEWCGPYPHNYDPSTRLIRLNGADVAYLFTTTVDFLNPDCQGPDDFAERSSGTITLVVGSNTLYAEIRDYWVPPYAGADQEVYTYAPPPPPPPPSINLVAPVLTSGSRAVVRNRQPVVRALLTPDGSPIDTVATVLKWRGEVVTGLARANRGLVEWEVDSTRWLAVGDSALIEVRACGQSPQRNGNPLGGVA